MLSGARTTTRNVPAEIAYLTREGFDFDQARGLRRDQVMHLATLDLVARKENVIFLGPPGTGKPTWRSGWRSAAAKPGTGCGTPARTRAAHRVRHRRVLRNSVAWSLLILKDPTSSLLDQHADPLSHQPMLRSEEPANHH
jgi:hypothetical protein